MKSRHSEIPSTAFCGVRIHSALFQPKMTMLEKQLFLGFGLTTEGKDTIFKASVSSGGSATSGGADFFSVLTRFISELGVLMVVRSRDIMMILRLNS